jgi:hypothetical protein
MKQRKCRAEATMTLPAFTVLRHGLRCCGAMTAICLIMTGCAPQTNRAPQPAKFASAVPANPAPEPSRWVAVPQQPSDPTLIAGIPPNQDWALASESARSIVFINTKEKTIIGNTVRVWAIRNLLVSSGAVAGATPGGAGPAAPPGASSRILEINGGVFRHHNIFMKTKYLLHVPFGPADGCPGRARYRDAPTSAMSKPQAARAAPHAASPST